jgi:hypothetical protein
VNVSHRVWQGGFMVPTDEPTGMQAPVGPDLGCVTQASWQSLTHHHHHRKLKTKTSGNCSDHKELL